MPITEYSRLSTAETASRRLLTPYDQEVGLSDSGGEYRQLFALARTTRTATLGVRPVVSSITESETEKLYRVVGPPFS